MTLMGHRSTVAKNRWRAPFVARKNCSGHVSLSLSIQIHLSNDSCVVHLKHPNWLQRKNWLELRISFCKSLFVHKKIRWTVQGESWVSLPVFMPHPIPPSLRPGPGIFLKGRIFYLCNTFMRDPANSVTDCSTVYRWKTCTVPWVSCKRKADPCKFLSVQILSCSD